MTVVRWWPPSDQARAGSGGRVRSRDRIRQSKFFMKEDHSQSHGRAAMDEAHKMRFSFARLLQFDLRFMLFATALAGVGILWWQDRQKLEQRLATIELRYKPFVGTAWSVDQATGPPDSLSGGDQPTAWASLTADSQEEWLELTYDRTIRPNAIEVYENCAPGALTKVTCFDASGSEQILWQGVDPTPPSSRCGVSKLSISKSPATNRIKIYLDSQAVVGWNEIDTIGLRYGMWGSVIWPSKAVASTSWAGGSYTFGTVRMNR